MEGELRHSANVTYDALHDLAVELREALDDAMDWMIGVHTLSHPHNIAKCKAARKRALVARTRAAALLDQEPRHE